MAVSFEQGGQHGDSDTGRRRRAAAAPAVARPDRAGRPVPGTRISETELAAAYEVSRQPVREAFIKLAEEGLLAVRPQRGTFILRISIPAVLTARFIREAVEADIVRHV